MQLVPGLRKAASLAWLLCLPLLVPAAVYSFAIRPVILACHCKYRAFNGLHSPEFAGMDNLDDRNSV